MDKDFYLQAIHREVKAFEMAAQLESEKPAPPVPTCPGWSVIDLLLHLGSGQRRIARLITDAAGLTERPARGDLSYIELPEPYLTWLKPGPAPTGQPMPLGLINWFKNGAEKLEAILKETDPALPVKSWGDDQTAGHWFRSLANEAAIHNWDAENAHMTARPIETKLAVSGIELFLGVIVLPERNKGVPTGTGESYHIHRTDGPGEWLIRFEPDGIKVSREHAKGDVALRGAASDLLLFLWGRHSKDNTPLEIFGESALLDRFFQLAPPI